MYFQGPHNVPSSISSHWTDLVVEDPFVVMSAGRSYFRVEDLLELARLIERLKP